MQFEYALVPCLKPMSAHCLPTSRLFVSLIGALAESNGIKNGTGRLLNAL
jgi:hypothetical protein